MAVRWSLVWFTNITIMHLKRVLKLKKMLSCNKIHTECSRN